MSRGVKSLMQLENEEMEMVEKQKESKENDEEEGKEKHQELCQIVEYIFEYASKVIEILKLGGQGPTTEMMFSSTKLLISILPIFLC